VELPPSVMEATNGPRLAALDGNAIQDILADAWWIPVGFLRLSSQPRRCVNVYRRDISLVENLLLCISYDSFCGT
jgi:hypothetical protein